MDNEEMEDRVRNGEELVHYGILGMKWGVSRSEAQLKKSRNNPSAIATAYKKAKNEYRGEKKAKRVKSEQDDQEAYVARTKARLDDSGGSKGKAAAKTAGKAAAAAVLLRVGGNVLGSITGKQNIARGIRVVTDLTTVGVMAESALRIIETSMLDNRK